MLTYAKAVRAKRPIRAGLGSEYGAVIRKRHDASRNRCDVTSFVHSKVGSHLPVQKSTNADAFASANVY